MCQHHWESSQPTNPSSPGQSNMMELLLLFNSWLFNTQCWSSTAYKKKSPFRCHWQRPWSCPSIRLTTSRIRVKNSLLDLAKICNHWKEVSGNSFCLCDLARREQILVEMDHKPLESIFKKSLLSAPCRLNNKDPWLAILDQRNTPTQSLGSSPAQRLMSCHTRALVPTATNLPQGSRKCYWKAEVEKTKS